MTLLIAHPGLSSIFSVPEVSVHLSAGTQLAYMLSVEVAHSRVLDNEFTVLTVEAVQVAPQDLMPGAAVDSLPVPELVRCLRAQIPQELHTDIHRDLTCQDVIDTALVLSLRDIFVIFQLRLVALQTAISELSHNQTTASLVGRTWMQAVVPITVSDFLATWSMPLGDLLTRLHEMLSRILRIQCAGPVGLHSGDALAVRLALVTPSKSWHAMRGGLCELAGWLSLFSSSLGKIGSDISVMAQQGLDEIHRVGGGTCSAMPHKKTILVELLVILVRSNAAQLAYAYQAHVHEQERLGAAWALEWMIPPKMIQTTACGLSVRR